MKFIIMMFLLNGILSIYFGYLGAMVAATGFFIVSSMFLCVIHIFKKIDELINNQSNPSNSRN